MMCRRQIEPLEINSMSSHSDSAHAEPLDLTPYRNVPMIAIIGGIVLMVLGYFAAGGGEPGVKQFGFSWLLAFMFFLSLCLGAFFPDPGTSYVRCVLVRSDSRVIETLGCIAAGDAGALHSDRPRRAGRSIRGWIMHYNASGSRAQFEISVV